jgi:hypothetical protein
MALRPSNNLIKQLRSKLITKSVIVALIATFSLTGNCGFAHEALFYKASRNYNEEGSLGVVYRRELENRMFTHPTWSERLYLSYDNPDIDETLEVYSRPNGSRWLNYRRSVDVPRKDASKSK